MCSKLSCSKESFDRFSDNLCELLLSYLSINESLKALTTGSIDLMLFGPYNGQ